MTHPPIPPAVAEWLAERALSVARPPHSPDLSPIRRTLALADRLVAQAEAAGIAIDTVDLYASGPDCAQVGLQLAVDGMAPALAVELGLTERRTQPYKPEPGKSIESFRGEFDGASVRVLHTLPTAVLTAEPVTR